MMTLKEVREAIQNAEAPKWFQNKEFSLSLPHINVELAFPDIASLHNYLARQVRGWKKIKDLPRELNSSKEAFEKALSDVEYLLVNSNGYSESTLENEWRRTVLYSMNQLERSMTMTYDAPETALLLDANKIGTDVYVGAYESLLKNNTRDIQNSNKFSGYMLAHEFKIKGEDSILNRSNKEKSSLTRLKSDFQKYFNETEVQFNENIATMQSNVKEQLEMLDEYHRTLSDKHNEWFNASQEETETFYKDTSEKREELERAYSELLKLSAPVEYWKARAEELSKQGWKVTYWLIALISVAAVSLFTLLWLAPEGILLSYFNDKVLAVKWSIIFVTFISFLAYGIRILSKIAFSSFHLASDAKERTQLTYLYLSLNKDGNVNASDRQIVLQSLFSRADTGLLKEEGGPTMPGTGTIIEKSVK